MAQAKQFDLGVEGLNELLRAFKRLPPEASQELRQRSISIAGNIMAPAWKDAAITYAGPWGFDLANSVKARRDRVPAVTVGNNKRTFAGGATSNMVRYPSDTGERGNSWAPFEPTHWMSKVRNYKDEAFRQWAQGLDTVIAHWNQYG